MAAAGYSKRLESGRAPFTVVSDNEQVKRFRELVFLRFRHPLAQKLNSRKPFEHFRLPETLLVIPRLRCTKHDSEVGSYGLVGTL